MSRGALRELLKVSPEKFNLMVKNMPTSEKPQVLHFLQNQLFLLENLR